MVTSLLNTWNNHAFTEEYPAKEVVWAEDAAIRREEARREVYLEENSDLRIRRHTSENTRHDSKASSKDRKLDDLMLLAVGSSEYWQAYNNKLTFTIDGEEAEISQGRLHEISKQYAEDLRAQIDSARRNNVSAADLALMQDELRRAQTIADASDPRRGPMSAEDQRRVQQALDQSEGLRNRVKEGADIEFRRDAGNTQEQSDIVVGAENGVETEAHFALMVSAESRTSYADQIEPSPLDQAVVSPNQDFNLVAPVTQPDIPEPAAPDAPKPNANAGLTL